MTVLTKRVTWARPLAPRQGKTPDLTAEEIANVKRAIAVMRARLGGHVLLAQAMGACAETVRLSAGRRRKPSVGLALRVARLAGVPLEDVLSGAWPREGSCPHCGRCDPS